MKIHNVELMNPLQAMGVENVNKLPKKKLLELYSKALPYRIEFAKAALTGLLSNKEYFDSSKKHAMIVEHLIFERALSMADGMIKESKILKL